MGLLLLLSLETLETVLTLRFLLPACVVAAAMLFGFERLAAREAAERKMAVTAADPSKDLSVSLAELASYDGTVRGRPLLVAVLGKVYDVGAGAALYGVDGRYHAFAGKDISVACAKFNKVAPSLLNCKWLDLTKDERALLAKWESVIAAKYPRVGAVSDPENYREVPAAEGDAEVAAAADAFSTKLGLTMFEKGHVAAGK